MHLINILVLCNIAIAYKICDFSAHNNFCNDKTCKVLSVIDVSDGTFEIIGIQTDGYLNCMYRSILILLDLQTDDQVIKKNSLN